MLITDIQMDFELRETIRYNNPLLRHSMYTVEYDHYARELIPWHWHDELELLYISSGSCTYRTTRGEYLLQAGDAIYLNPGVLHALEPLEKKTVSYANLFEKNFLCGADGSYFDIQFLAPVVQQKQVEAIPFFHENQEDEMVLGAIRQTIRLCRDEPMYYEFSLRSILSEIWTAILQRVRNAKEQIGMVPCPDVNNTRLKSMMQYIIEHYRETIQISQLAEAAHISERECYRIFQQQIGVSPAVFIQQYRIQKAKDLLDSTGLSVTSIASMTGFDHTSYFGKLFRKYLGMTPLEYRKLAGSL